MKRQFKNRGSFKTSVLKEQPLKKAVLQAVGRETARACPKLTEFYKKLNIFVLFFMALIFLSCESMPVNYSRSKSWLLGKKNPQGTFSLIGISVDRIGGWDSLEREMTALAPLSFWEEGFQMIAGDKPADYAADIQLREREYSSGWRTKRSLSVEVRVWAYEDPGAGKTAYAQTLPLAAGRVISTGDRSLSSFETTNRMLSKAIRKAVRQLASQKGKA